jgi:hypothetical protein
MAVPIIYNMNKFGEMLYHNLWVTLNDDLAFRNQNVKVFSYNSLNKNTMSL